MPTLDIFRILRFVIWGNYSFVAKLLTIGTEVLFVTTNDTVSNANNSNRINYM